MLPEFAKTLNTAAVLHSLWMPQNLNWWIGLIFAGGSALFAIASILSLWPEMATGWRLEPQIINAIFFCGSIPFTVAAYLQLFQVANAPAINAVVSQSQGSVKLFGWRPRDIGWLSCAMQFAGTILFNVNTFDAMLPALSWFEQDVLVWIPNLVGSILFLLSGYLAFIEVCHAHWSWRPGSVSWWVVSINLLGCIGFMASALSAMVLPGPKNAVALALSVAFTLQGAVCFMLGALLMLPEAYIHLKTAHAGRDNA